MDPASMIQLLGKPEYLHTLLNSLPTHGLALGVLALVVSLFTRRPEGRVVALCVVLVSALSAFPAYEFGEAASDKVAATADDDGTAWLEEHEHRAEKAVWVFYVLAALSAAALAAQRGSEKAGVASAAATLALSLAAMGAGGYIAYAGGKIQHRSFRVEPPPVSAPDRAGRAHADD